MNKEFIPYEQALELKELGFDEQCLACYLADTLFTSNDIIYNSTDIPVIKAPLYQQAFRWFEYKGYRNYVASNQFGGKVNYWFAITPPEELTYSDTEGRTIKEEAELACLKKLIELVKNK
jgi:hypothetical protein